VNRPHRHRARRLPERFFDHDRVYVYVENFFARHNQEQWPTVRQVARGLRWRQQRVQDAIDGDPDGRLYTTHWYTNCERDGDHFVESYGEA
jgi:hypothetical protein